jgi:hypothetical protein
MMSKAFLGGVPTRMDVERLFAEVTAEPGTTIDCDAVAAIIGVAATDNRFTTVTSAWRRELFRARGLRTLREGGAFLFLTPEQALEAGLRDYKRAGRATGRATVRTKSIDPRQLTDAGKEKQRLAIRMGEEMLDAAQRGMKAIAPPKPVTSNVRVLKSGAA